MRFQSAQKKNLRFARKPQSATVIAIQCYSMSYVILRCELKLYVIEIPQSGYIECYDSQNRGLIFSLYLPTIRIAFMTYQLRLIYTLYLDWHLYL